MNVKEAVQEYQCPGCVNGPFPECYKPSSEDAGSCLCHCVGTMISNIGKVFLGLPKGFNRLGVCDKMPLSILTMIDYDKFNMPVWKQIDKHGNTLIRGLCPRINQPFLHIFLGDCRGYIKGYEITNFDIENMD